MMLSIVGCCLLGAILNMHNCGRCYVLILKPKKMGDLVKDRFQMARYRIIHILHLFLL